MARQGGLEPPTTGLEIRCSIQLSYWRAPVIPFDRLRLDEALPEKIAGVLKTRKFTRQLETGSVEKPASGLCPAVA